MIFDWHTQVISGQFHRKWKMECEYIYITDGWFGTCFIFHILGIIMPTDFHTFQRGWNHQTDEHKKGRKPTVNFNQPGKKRCRMIQKKSPGKSFWPKFLGLQLPWISHQISCRREGSPPASYPLVIQHGWKIPIFASVQKLQVAILCPRCWVFPLSTANLRHIISYNDI